MSTRATLPISGLAATLLAVLVAAGVATSPAAAHPPEPVPPTDGALSWGDNGAGQLGDGSSDPSTTPVEVALPEGVTVTQVAAGSDHGLALTSDGRVLAWGSNAVGQLGDGTTTDRTTPVEVQLPEGVTVIRLSAGEGHSLALTDDGRVLAWGGNVDGQLGDGTQLTRSTPVEVELPAGAEITGISAGRNHSLAVTSDGGVLAWGWNSDGQLGDGTTTTRTTPVEVPLPDGVTVADVSGGNRHSLAVTTTGRVLTWGYNGQGQLGDGTGTGRLTPVEVQLPQEVVVTQAITRGDHGLALTADDRVLSWGLNNSGQLGDGTTTNSDVPVEVDTGLPAGQRVVQLAAGWWYSLALTTGRAATDTSLTADPTEAAPGDDVTLTATVTCTGATPTGTVTFLDGRAELGTAPLDGSGAASLTTNRLGVGEHRIRARYDGDDTCGPSISDPVTVTVAETPPTTTRPTTQPTPPAPSPTDRPQPTTSDVAPVAPTPPSGASPSTPDTKPHDPLAATGVPAGALAAGALALIAAGLALTLWTRRRRDN